MEVEYISILTFSYNDTYNILISNRIIAKKYIINLNINFYIFLKKYICL